MKKYFTAVVRAMMNLSRAKFLYGCYGYNLDVLARGPIWDLDLDFQCGTGHGVGYLANVHEPPTGFKMCIRDRNTISQSECRLISLIFSSLCLTSLNCSVFFHGTVFPLCK